jgi:hypothetical protein
MCQIKTAYVFYVCGPVTIVIITDFFCADTTRRTDADTRYDEPPTAKQQHTTDTQSNRTEGVQDQEHEFTAQIVALIGLHSLQSGLKFNLSFNREDAGNYDSFVYTADGWRIFQYMLHTDSPDEKLTKGELVTILQKFLKSYCDIKHGKDLRDIPFYKTAFIIYTNRELDPELPQHKGDVFFQTCDKEIFLFPDKNKEMNVYTLLENLFGRETASELDKLIIVTVQKDKWQPDDEICKVIKENNAKSLAFEMCKTDLLYFKTQVKNLVEEKRRRYDTKNVERMANENQERGLAKENQEVG